MIKPAQPTFMKKIVYISPHNFFDVDFPILPELNKKYELLWIPIIPIPKSRYSVEDVVSFCGKHNIKNHIFLRKGRRRSIKQFLFSLRLLAKVRKEKPDIIYTEYLKDPYLAFLGILFLPKKKTIYAIHDVASHIDFDSLSIIFIEKAIRFFFRYFQIFSATQKQIFDNKYSSKQSFYAPLALKDFGMANAVRPKKKHCNFLFFGNIADYKGLDLLIMAIEELISDGYNDFSLTIAGNGIAWPSCEKLIKNRAFYKLKIEFIPDSDVPNLFTLHHFLILPYRDVTQSGPQMIAFNYNLPIVASDHEGFLEYIKDNETGFLFFNEDKSSLKQILKKCIKMSVSDYRVLCQNIESEVEKKYKIEKITSKYNKMFQTVLKSKM